MARRALITGIAGQDGSYLAEYLLALGYQVHGVVRRHSVAETQQARLEHLQDRLTLHYGDVTDFRSVEEALRQSTPDEVYHLAAQSDVRVSFELPLYTAQVTALGVLTVLEAVRSVCPHTRFYQASSSEMFGNSADADGCQRETTPMQPVSPYGCAKLFGHTTVRNYRHAHGLFACSGILFNHESPRRGSNFVTAKIARAAVEIKLGLREKVELGNLDACRDWGHAADYVRAMHSMLNHREPDDFVVATGQSRSVRDVCRHVFGRLGLRAEDHVVQDGRLLRPEELRSLKGDATKARQVLGWAPTTTFEQTLDEMVDYWLERL